MNYIFKDFDFNVLENKQFKEDAVREEIVAPILKKLGFKPSGLKKVIRGKKLTHPFVSIGSTRKKVTIIPDYILFYNDIPILVLDAKAPTEDINSGKHVEQVFSYSIHPEVKTFYYALCNGKDLNIFSRSELEPQKFSIRSIEDERNWMSLERVIDAIEEDTLQGIKITPDFGMILAKAGVKNTHFCKFGAIVASISKVSDSLFLIVVMDRYGPALADLMYLSFLLKKKHLKYFKSCLNSDYELQLSRPLSESPFTFYFDKLDVFLDIYAFQNFKFDFKWGSFRFLPFDILYLEKSNISSLPSTAKQIGAAIKRNQAKFFK